MKCDTCDEIVHKSEKIDGKNLCPPCCLRQYRKKLKELKARQEKSILKLKQKYYYD